MRKVLSFVLVLTLVLGSFGFVFADDANTTTTSAKTSKLSDIEGLDCEDAVRVLSSLDVVSGYADGTYKPEQTVTRAEMASLLIKALGMTETNAVPKFTDSQNHWAKGFIAYANTLGIISGRTATVFDPDATVTYDEATTMIIKALGYTDDALVGTYPASYVSRAKVLGILDGIQTGAAGANRGDIATMIYQALDQAIGKVDKDGNFNATVIEWEKGSNNTTPKRYDTMLDRLGAKMYNEYTKAYEVDEDDQSFVVTGDEDSIINLNPFKGAVVSAYMNKDKDIIAIKEVFSTFVSGTIDGDAIGDYDLKADALADIATSGTAILFENGDEASFEVMTNDTVNYTLAADVSGKKINEVYSVALWKISAHDVVEAEDIKDIEDNHKFLGVDFVEDNNDDIDLDSFELYGVASLDDIKADMVAYVYKNDDGISRIAVGDKTVTGEVTRVNDGGTKVTIDGTVYKFASEELEGNNGPNEVTPGDIEAGDEVKLTLDAYGYIYDSEKTDSKADKFAIVLKTEDKEPNKISSDAKIKMFLADGTVKTFNADEDEIDNKILDATSGEWQAPIKTGALVKYGVDKDGVITDMNIGDGTDDLTLYEPTKTHVSAKGYLGSKTVATDAVVFNYDGGTLGVDMSDDEDDYSVLSYEKILDCDDTNITYVYDTKDKKVVAILAEDAAASADVFGVVVDKAKNNSDAGAEYDLLIDGKAETKNGTDSVMNDETKKKFKYDVPTNEKGELYLIKFDSDGDVKEFASWKDGGDDAVKAETSGSAVTYSKNEISFVSGGAFTLEDGSAATADGITLDKNVIVYVNDGGDWDTGSTSDLRNLAAADYTKIVAYDIADEDEIFDIVLLYK